MRLLVLLLTICLVAQLSWADAGSEKQIKLEDIERDTLIGESKKASEEKEDNPQAAENTQHIQLTYSNSPQDVYVTPQPGKYQHIKDLRSNIYHLPKVHEEEQTFTVPAKQSLIQPLIGGGPAIQPLLTPQPHYIYIQSPHHHQTPYMPQAHAYMMVPFSHYTSSTPVHHHSVLPTPTPTVYTYSHGPTSPPPHSYQPIKSTVEYAASSEAFKNIETIVPKNKLPSAETTSFQQYYSPGVEFHYTEMVPITKLSYHHPGAPSPIHNYHAQSNLLTSSHGGGHSYNYFISPSTHHSSSSSFPQITSPKHHQSLNHHYMSSFKNHLPYHHQRNYFPSQQPPQHPLFTPAAAMQSPQYTPYPLAHAYNTIQYSVAMPPYDHSKRSTKATTSINVKAPKV